MQEYHKQTDNTRRSEYSNTAGTRAQKLQAPLSGIFHSTVTQTYSIYLQRFPPDHHGCGALPELYDTSGVVGNFSLCDTNEQTLAQSLNAVN